MKLQDASLQKLIYQNP